MLITLRDLEFLNDLKSVRYINSKTVEKLFGNYKSAMRRLKVLEKNKIISRIDQTSKGENIYCLAKKGYSILNANYKRISKTEIWEHCLGTINVYFYLKSTQEVKRFILEKQYDFKYENKKYSFRIDALIQTDRYYFFEMDLSYKGYERKIVAWESFFKSGEFLKCFDKFPPILIVTNDVEKVKSIIDKLSKINFNYVIKDYKEIREWEYKYLL